MIHPGDIHSIHDALLGTLRTLLERPDMAYAAPPTPLFGGHQSFVYGFRLASAPQPYAGPLVLRIPLDQHSTDRSDDVGLEASVHAALIAAGFPVPRVLTWSADARALGGAYQIMERVPGRPLMRTDFDSDNIGPRTFLFEVVPSAVAALVGDWPSQLAHVQAHLARLDAHVLLEALHKDGFGDADLHVAARIERLASDVAWLGLQGLDTAIDWLRSNCPDPAVPSICHGDLFPNQVYSNAGAISGVIDWSDVGFAPPEFDIGIVKAGLETMPIPLPGASALKRWLVGKYMSKSREQQSIDAEALRYGEAYRCVQVLVGVGRRRRALSRAIPLEPAPTPYDHPLAIALLDQRIRELAGVEVCIPDSPET